MTKFSRAIGPAKVRRRHFFLLLSFYLWVITPVVMAGSYLFTVAKDQYASHVGFSVRQEDSTSAIELLGGLNAISGSGSSDADILYEFIRSQKMVQLVHEKLDLTRLYAAPEDPVFGLGEDRRIEALVTYWQRMVNVYYDHASQLIEVRALAFTPEDAQNITEIIFDESSRMINDLSAIAREDTTRYARAELELAIMRLKNARISMTEYQNRTRILDPMADLQGQMGLLNLLQKQLAELSIEVEVLRDTSREKDPRIKAALHKIEAIKKLIKKERETFGRADDENGSFSQLLAEFQELKINLEFAEKSYLAAQAAFDVAQAEAMRKSRYLASYITPTLAQTAEYPRRVLILLILGGALFLSWSIMVMIYYALRDRR